MEDFDSKWLPVHSPTISNLHVHILQPKVIEGLGIPYSPLTGPTF